MPGHLLARYQVVIDYPAREFTLALPDTLEMKGTRFSTPVSSEAGVRALGSQDRKGSHMGFFWTAARHTRCSNWRATGYVPHRRCCRYEHGGPVADLGLEVIMNEAAPGIVLAISANFIVLRLLPAMLAQL